MDELFAFCLHGIRSWYLQERRSNPFCQLFVYYPHPITGFYKIKSGISRKDEVFDVVKNVNFTVVDNIGIVQCIGNERKNALLALQLPWKIKYFESQPESDM